jgi:hypothetical protein
MTGSLPFGEGIRRLHWPPVPLPDWPMWAPSPYPDLYAYPSFRMQQDEDTNRLFVSGRVGNRGGVPADRSVTVAVGVSTYFGEAFRRTDERRTRMGEGLRPGDIAYTEPTVAPLKFHPDGYNYILEIRVDVGHELSDATRDNNYYWYSYWAYPIGQLLGEESQAFTIKAEDLDRTDSSG